jgi:hypothetical protein
MNIIRQRCVMDVMRSCVQFWRWQEKKRREKSEDCDGVVPPSVAL